MFDAPKNGSIFDTEDGRYVLKLVALEPSTHPEYGDRVIWKFNVATMEGEVLLNDHGFNAELWQFTSTKMSKGGKQPATARLWAEALLGREIDDAELQDADERQRLVQSLLNKKAIALLAHNASERIRIASLKPMPKATSANGATKPAARPAPASTPDEPPDEVVAQNLAVAEAF